MSSLFAEKEMSQYDDDIQSESPLSASSPPADWKRTSKDYLKIAIIVVTVLIFVLNVSLFKRFSGVKWIGPLGMMVRTVLDSN